MSLQQFVQAIHDAKRIVVLTGAGMSTASGLSDFRSNGGLWDGRDPLEISHASKIGTPEFRDFFRERAQAIRRYHPNPGHDILEEWRERYGATIITQNIDGYHGKHAIEMHGHMRYFECNHCAQRYASLYYNTVDDTRCPKCFEGTIRPPVVLYGEDIPVSQWTDAMAACLTADFILVVGTSLEVRPFSDLLEIGLSNRARTAIITKSGTPYDGKVSFRSYGDIVEVLQELNTHLGLIQHGERR